ncbi:MAG: lipase, partial [Alistipes sp.]|nr:lipase [Alistipes sp.]
MKKINMLLLVLALFSVNVVVAQKNVKWVDAQSLTHLGKLCKTTNPYHRVEVANYPELNTREAQLLRKSAGESIVFETNST